MRALNSLAVRAARFKSSDGAELWTRITDGLADDLDSMIWHPWIILRKPRAHCRFFNVVRGHASISAGAGDLMVRRIMGKSWQRLDINLPADRVLWAAAD
jgi:hypothetical protein